MGISTYQTEKYFKLIRDDDEYVHLSRGFLEPLITFFKEKKIKYAITDEREMRRTVTFSSKINLYEYQQQALAAIETKDVGVIVAPPGAGKTVLGLELVAIKAQPTLIIVHRKQLFDQWIERIQAFLGIPKNQIGQIAGNKKQLGKEITVAMMQSLIKMENIKSFADSFGTLIVDECHHIPAKTFRELIVKFTPYYLYGLTATPKRKYNDEKLIYYYIGDILYEVAQNQISEKHETEQKLHIQETALSVPFDYKTDTFETFSKILIYDTKRNQLIADDIVKEVTNGRKVLILTERKEHVEVLNLYLKAKSEVITLTGDDAPGRRKVKMDQITQGTFSGSAYHRTTAG